MRKATLNLGQMSGAAFLHYWQLSPGTVELAMHAIALYQDKSYLAQPASELVRRMQLYRESLLVGEGPNEPQPSPFLYPLYGMGELPQAFSRLSSVFGGTFLLERPVDEVLYDEAGGACGVRCGDETASARCVIGDPSYFPAKVRTACHVVRVIALMKCAPRRAVAPSLPPPRPFSAARRARRRPAPLTRPARPARRARAFAGTRCTARTTRARARCSCPAASSAASTTCTCWA